MDNVRNAGFANSVPDGKKNYIFVYLRKDKMVFSDEHTLCKKVRLVMI